MSIIDHLETHRPGYGPEWGSGGIFGLKLHRGVLYYTLAFEARSYFIDKNGIRRIYHFENVGFQPVSGGDTYNAVDAVDGEIFFGGWVHAPAVYRGRIDHGATIDFRNKYSHVHVYDVDNDSVRLLWKEGMHHPEKWVGEVSEIIYNPVHDELLIARGDGHENLGIYSIDHRSGKAVRLIDRPAIYGAQHVDHACFTIHQWIFKGIECIDMVTHKTLIHEINDLSRISIDGDGTYYPLNGAVASLMNRLYSFIRGGLIYGDPLDPDNEPLRFIRLLDLGYSQIGPHRTNTLPLGGGLLVPFNTYSHALMNPENEEARRALKKMNTVVSPTLLLYIAPPTIRIAAALGARVTSMERIGDKIVLATNTQANLGRIDATPIDTGIRDFTVLPTSIINQPPPPVTISIPDYMHREGWMGGIPLEGYKEARIIVKTRKPVKLLIKTIDPWNGELSSETDIFQATNSRNVIDLSTYRGELPIFKYDEITEGLKTVIILE